MWGQYTRIERPQESACCALLQIVCIVDLLVLQHWNPSLCCLPTGWFAVPRPQFGGTVAELHVVALASMIRPAGLLLSRIST